jgi:hypothetical protein
MNWKNFERKVAEITGGKRIPINGRKQLDVKHPIFGIECKYRKSLPDWLFKHAWSQAVDGSSIDQIPLVCVGEFNSKKTFAIMELRTLIKIMEEAVDCFARNEESSTGIYPNLPEHYGSYGGTDPD